MARLRVVFLSILAISSSACDKVPRVQWEDARPLTEQADSVDLFGEVRRRSPTPPASFSVSDSLACVATAAIAADDSIAFAAWWSVRADSSATLVGRASTDGGATWGATFTIDSLDRGDEGCRRHAPALVVQRGQMYAAYSMHAAEGTGIFFAHWMMGMVHSPVTVLYGDRVVPVALAVRDSMVAVAYEDPSSRTPLVGVAVSRTEGHAFEYHARASSGEGAATRPAVDVHRDRVAVSWTPAQGGRLVRIGRLQ
jgi:hypothetical protein